MPNFSSTVPKDPRGPAFPLIRTPANGSLIAVITSDDLIGCNTHFYGGRTQPCEAPDCPACAEGIPWRWHGYVSVLIPKSAKHVLYECTALAAQEFAAHRDLRSTLRGCLFEATRAGKRANGRVFIRCKMFDDPNIKLPTAPDLPKVLAIIWNLPLHAIVDAGSQWDHPSLALDSETAKTAAAIDRDIARRRAAVTRQPSHTSNGD